MLLTEPSESDRRRSRGRRPVSAVGWSSRPALRFNTVLLYLSQGRRLDQEALPFVTAAAAAEPDDHRKAPAFRLRPPRQRRITGRQEFKIIEAAAAQAGRAGIFHDQEIAIAATAMAFPFSVQGLNNDQVRGTGCLFRQPLALPLGQRL